jgi:hypothetical protein
MRLFQIALTAFTLMAGLVSPQTLAAEPQSIVGDWEGQLDTGRSKLLVVLHVDRSRDGKFAATLEGITKQQLDVEVKSIKFSAPDLHFAIEGGNGVYDAKLSHEGTKLVGVWKQGDAVVPLVFHRVTDDFVQNLTSHPLIEVAETWTVVRVAIEHGIGHLRMLITAYAVSATREPVPSKGVVQLM